MIHKAAASPSDASSQPGQGPQLIVFGTVMGLDYDNPTDAAYRIMKIDKTFVGDGSGADASFHVHWTKSGDADESGNTIRWRLSYTLFDGSSDDIVVAPTVVDFDDTYVDAGTTSKIVYRTPSVPATGLVPNYYMGIKLEYVPANTTLTSTPVCVSCDLLFRNRINLAG
jgi:hypothetical protein